MKTSTRHYLERMNRQCDALREGSEIKSIEGTLKNWQIYFERTGLIFRFENLDDLLHAREKSPALNKYTCRSGFPDLI